MKTEYEIRPFDFPVVLLFKRLNNNVGVDVKLHHVTLVIYL